MTRNNVQALNMLNNFLGGYNLTGNFKWRKIVKHDIKQCISKINSSRSEDYYGFSNMLVKKIIFAIMDPLVYLYNMMLEQGVFPSILKLVKVIPIYKKGDKLSPSSYRPISLVPIFGKIFEHCIKEQLYDYFSSNNLLCKEQFGFMPGSSTAKAVESVVNNVISSFESKVVQSATLIDLTKAFDCISHNLLLDKLGFYGIKGIELDLLSSYLCNRKQMVVQGNDQSNFKETKNGVPQGSVLGPFLFIVAVNDLAHNVPCKSVLYADDTTLLNSNNITQNLISEQELSLKKAIEWFQANFLVVNDDKTEKISFTLDNMFENFKTVKLLGIYLDSKLNWECHVQNVCKKLARVVFLLRKLKLCVSFEILIMSYYAFFHSHLIYGINLWGNSRVSSKAFVWQKKALRIIKGIPDRESALPVFREFQVMTLPCIYIFYCLIKVKENLSDYKVRGNTHNYNTRNINKLELPSIRLERTKKSHFFMEIKIFNKLPERAWLVSTDRFKFVVSKWLKEKVFYSVDEFLACDTSDMNF
uniref:Reverse transcriptase domain-containing protein n=2 Tax=Graphocephala atropunctata TaxID=36148 RepID=A0A1B6KT88_9HEMI